jgi:hypothetical protein
MAGRFNRARSWLTPACIEIRIVFDFGSILAEIPRS